MKNQALFSAKDKSKKLKCCLLQFLFGILRVKVISEILFVLCMHVLILACLYECKGVLMLCL